MIPAKVLLQQSVRERKKAIASLLLLQCANHKVQHAYKMKGSGQKHPN